MKNTKTHIRTVFIYLFLLIVSITLMTACSNTQNEDEEHTNMLTNIYTSVAFEVDDDFWMIPGVMPYYNETEQTITVFSLKTLEKETEDGEFENYRLGLLTTFSMDGNVIETERVPLDEYDVYYTSFGTITEDALFFIYENNYLIYRYDRTTCQITAESDTLSYFYENDDTQITNYASDSDDMQYISDGNTLFVFNSDLSLSFSLDFPAPITSMVRGADGDVWVSYKNSGQSYVAKIDTKNRAMGDTYAFAENAGNTKYLSCSLLSTTAIIDGVSFFYYDAVDSIYAVSVSEENALLTERLMDLYNSNVTVFYDVIMSRIFANQGIIFSTVLSKDIFITSNYVDFCHGIPTLYIKADDVDLDSIETITVAYTTALDNLMLDEINEFREKHPDVRIVLSDYTIYKTDDNKNGAENQLCFDINNGILKPDIVITATPSSTISDDDAVYYLTRNNLYVDLAPYLEKDDELNFDTLFGCMRKIFDDGKDGMWGISREVELSTYIGDREILGEYAEKGIWTFDEMLDFFDSCLEDPEKDVMLGFVHYQLERIFMNSVNSFYEDGTYNFDNDTFVHYLEMLNSIPESYNQWKETSPNATINETQILMDAISLGKIGLTGYSVYNLSDIQYGGSEAELMLSDKYYNIGYPTNGDTCKTYAYAPDAYIITTFADNPELCFEFLKEFIITDTYETNGATLGSIESFLPAVRSQFLAASAEKQEFAVDPFTDETAEKIADMFEDSGYPIIKHMPTAIYDIISEEFSTYACGMGTAEDCAKKIQSRVNIWVSEHE